MALRYYLGKLAILSLYIGCGIATYFHIPYVPILGQFILGCIHGWWLGRYISACWFYYYIEDEEAYHIVQEAVGSIFFTYGEDVLLESAYDTDATVIAYVFYTLMCAGAILLGYWVLLASVVATVIVIYITKLQIRGIMESIIWDIPFEEQEELY